MELLKTYRVQLAIGAIILVGIAFSLGYLFSGDRQQSDQRIVDLATSAKRNQELIQEISALIVLPADETPTIATVTDLSKLRNQPFFANAKTGDRVFIYTKAKKAILYDPIQKKIIEVAPLNVGTVDSENPLGQ